MNEWRQKKYGKFSKGMRQRIALASALLHNPEILILDEPTSGLDPRGRSEIKQIIKSLKKDGKTIFMSSHLLGETQAICDEVALIDKGKFLGLKSINELQTTNKSKKSKSKKQNNKNRTTDELKESVSKRMKECTNDGIAIPKEFYVICMGNG